MKNKTKTTGSNQLNGLNKLNQLHAEKPQGANNEHPTSNIQHRNGGAESEIPNSKNQIPKKSQVPNPNWEGQETEPWPEPVDGGVLLDAIRDMVKRFVVVPAWGIETLALWILHTFAYELRDVSTYLGIESPEKQCGKTTLLTVLSELVNRPVVSSNVSPPALFRAIEELRPTLLIDEADTFLKGNDEFRGILNAGYTRKTAFVLRVQHAECRMRNAGPEGSKPQAPKSKETPNSKSQISKSNDTSPQPSPRGGEGDGTSKDGALEQNNTRDGHLGVFPDAPYLKNQNSRLARFSCWCPKVMCSIGHLPDTLADRCIVIRMQRKRPDETCERLRNLETKTIKRQCLKFVMDHGEAIAAARPEMPASLSDRATDIWEPLLTLADLAGGHWPDTARKAAVSLSASAQQSNPIGSLLFDIYLLFITEKVERMFTRTLIEELARYSERPWQEMKNGKELTGPWLAQLLRPYGIRPRTIWIGESAAKGYVLEEMKEPFRRYIPRSEFEALKAEWAEEDRAREQASEARGQKSEGGGEKTTNVNRTTQESPARGLH